MFQVAFFFIAESYQSYHALSIAYAMARDPRAEVTVIFNDPASPRHIERVRRAMGAEPLHCRPVLQTPLIRALSKFRSFGLNKRLVMKANVDALEEYDAIIAVEKTTAMLRGFGLDRPRLVYVPHGAGDRARSFEPRIAAFDLVLPNGPKNAHRMLEAGLIQEGHYAEIGYPKLDIPCGRIDDELLFSSGKPILVYNPHAMRGLSSWDRFAEPLAGLAESGQFNLIVAPHIKLFGRRNQAEATRWAGRNGPHVHVDLASDRLVDMTYATMADIYVGDVSSQVYEFLLHPRPCVFLNAHGVAWRDDPNYAHWHYGEVVDDPADLAAAIERAPMRHGEFRGLQQRAVADAMGDCSPGISERAASTILDYLSCGRIDARRLEVLEAC